MGGGDLNLKKSWHPGTFRNQEKVWKEERKAAEEDKKIAQKRKELEEERQIQELQQIQESSGARKRAERVEWLYAAPNQSNKTGSDMEEYLLGKRRVDDLFKQKNDSQQITAPPESRLLAADPKANTERDIAAKIREDPLLAIKKREQASLKAIMDNPVKMRELKALQDGSNKKSKKDKKEKKHGKSKRDNEDYNKHKEDYSKHKSRKRRLDDSDNSDGSDDRNYSKRRRNEDSVSPYSKHHTSSRRLPSRSRSRSRSHSPDNRRYRPHQSSRDRVRDHSTPPPAHRLSNPPSRVVGRQHQEYIEINESSRRADAVRRLASMIEDGTKMRDERDAREQKRMREEREEEQREQEEREKRRDGNSGGGFLDETRRSNFTSAGDLVDRVRRNRAFLQRDGGD